MPDRILRERICASETMAQLDWGTEVFFYRLLVQCDDFGRCDGRPSVLRARCYQVQLDQVTETDVAEWLARLAEVGLVQLYTNEGRAYLQVETWTKYQRIRASESKFPPPPSIEEARGHLTSSDDSRQHMSALDDSRQHLSSSADIRGSRAPDQARALPEAEANANAYSNANTRSEKRNANAETKAAEPPPAPPPDLPDELQDFDEILRRLRAYQPTPEFYAWVRETCVNIDLRAEAIKLVDHARRNNRAGNLKYITGWLEKAVNPPWDDAAPSSRSRANLVGPVSPPAAPRPLPPPKPELPPEERQRVNTWKLALERIKSETPDPHLFKAWFGGTRLAACNELTAAIEADEYQLPLLEKNRAKIARALGIDQELVELRARPVPVGASP